MNVRRTLKTSLCDNLENTNIYTSLANKKALNLRYNNNRAVFNISLCGASAVGKSSIAKCLAKKKPNLEYLYTIGIDYFTRDLPQYNIKINGWDLAGDKRFNEIIYPFVQNSTVLVYVYDITRQSSVTELEKSHQYYINKGKITKKIIIVGNKTDLETNYNSCVKSGEKFAKTIDAAHLVVSAIKNHGINELLQSILNKSGIKKKTQHITKETSKKRQGSFKNDEESCKKCVLL